jgi:uncharacterized protein (TIGR02391 family)
MTLLQRQIEGIEQIAQLPFDHPNVEEWERKTASVLRAVFGEQDDRAFQFLQLAQTEEFSPYAELWSDETEGDEVKHARLLARRRALLRESLFSLEHLSSRPFESEGYALHSEIEKVSGKVFRDGHFREAAFNAYVSVIEEVKAKTGLLDRRTQKPMDGEPLMRQAFDCENNKTPSVRFNDLKTESDRDEQQGFMHLFLGLVRLRHSKAHSVRPFDDPSRAHEYLCLASLLMRLLDNATVELQADAPEEQTS